MCFGAHEIDGNLKTNTQTAGYTAFPSSLFSLAVRSQRSSDSGLTLTEKVELLLAGAVKGVALLQVLPFHGWAQGSFLGFSSTKGNFLPTQWWADCARGQGKSYRFIYLTRVKPWMWFHTASSSRNWRGWIGWVGFRWMRSCWTVTPRGVSGSVWWTLGTGGVPEELYRYQWCFCDLLSRQKWSDAHLQVTQSWGTGTFVKDGATQRDKFQNQPLGISWGLTRPSADVCNDK